MNRDRVRILGRSVLESFIPKAILAMYLEALTDAQGMPRKSSIAKRLAQLSLEKRMHVLKRD